MAKNLRASEQELFTFKNRTDISRRKNSSNRQNLIDLLISLIAITVGTAILTHMETLIGAAICFGTGIVLLLYAKRSEQIRTAIERSEFLNALFSSALGQNYRFCMITTQDGQIVYLNYGFQAIFPKLIETPKRSLAKLFSSYSFPADKAKAITAAVKKGSKKELTAELAVGKNNKKEKFKISIEPIARPSGFVLIRGV